MPILSLARRKPLCKILKNRKNQTNLDQRHFIRTAFSRSGPAAKIHRCAVDPICCLGKVWSGCLRRPSADGRPAICGPIGGPRRRGGGRGRVRPGTCRPTDDSHLINTSQPQTPLSSLQHNSLWVKRISPQTTGLHVSL